MRLPASRQVLKNSYKMSGPGLCMRFKTSASVCSGAIFMAPGR